MHRCPIVVAKVDRLTRSVGFLHRLLDANVDVRFADLPQIEGATGRLVLTQMAAVAELEAGMISVAYKSCPCGRQGARQETGWLPGHRPFREGSRGGTHCDSEALDARARDLGPIITELRAAGAASLRSLAAALDERGIPTARGKGRWSAEQVRQVLARL